MTNQKTIDPGVISRFLGGKKLRRRLRALPDRRWRVLVRCGGSTEVWRFATEEEALFRVSDSLMFGGILMEAVRRSKSVLGVLDE